MVLQTILFLLSASVDNLLVGLSYGIKNIRIDPINNVIIATLSGAFTLVSMLFGRLATNVLPPSLELRIGSGLLILIGVYFIYSCWKPKPIEPHHKRDLYGEFLQHPEIADTDHSSTIDTKEAIVIGAALSMNNFGLGLGASIIGLNPAACCILSFLFSLLFIKLGCLIANNMLSSCLKRTAGPVSGLIIIFLGIYSLLR